MRGKDDCYSIKLAPWIAMRVGEAHDGDTHLIFYDRDALIALRIEVDHGLQEWTPG